MLQISKVLFEKWNSEHILYCHWKSNEHLEPGLDGDTDLDVLLDSKDEVRALLILRELRFLNCKSQYGSRYPKVSDWLGFDAETGKMIHVHLHLTIVTGHRGMKEYNLPWTETALETRVKDKKTGVFIMEPNLELVTLYTRIALKANCKKVMKAKKNEFRLADDVKRELEYLKKRVDTNEVRAILAHYFNNCSLDIAAIVERDELLSKDFLKLIDMVEESMQPYCRYSRLKALMLKHYYIIALAIRSKIKNNYNIISRKTPQQGLLIAFIGQDGAGKSTVTAEIEKWLSWKLDVHRYYLGSGDHYSSWQRTLQEKLPRKKSPVLLFFTAMLSLSKYKNLAQGVLTAIKCAQQYKAQGGIALFDRYPQTQYPGINDGPKIRKLLDKTENKLMRAIINAYAAKEEKYLIQAEALSPDLVFKMILPIEESLRRKPHESRDAIERKHEIVRSLKYPESKVFEIDATMDYQQEIIKIKNILWQNIQK